MNGFLCLLIFILCIMLSPFEKVEKVINNTITIEGGFSNNPNDSGGATKFGITIGTYKRYMGPNATVDQLKVISANEARQFYKEYFFYANHIQEFPENIWDIMFDMCVNHGPSNAFTVLELALNRLGYKVLVDGKFGPEMQAAAAKAGTDKPEALRAAIINQRLVLYSAIIRNKPSQKAFAAGWMNRTASFITAPVRLDE